MSDNKSNMIKEQKGKIDILRKELNNTEELKDKRDINKLEEQKLQLSTVKNTILYLREKGELIKAESSSYAERLSVRKSSINRNMTEETNPLNKNPMIIILMVFSGIMAVLLLNAWIDVNGYEINLFELTREAENLSYIFGSTEEIQGIIAFLWFICIIQAILAIYYLYIIYDLYKNRKSHGISFTMFGVIIIFLVSWGLTLSVNSSVDDIYRGLSNYISAGLTGKAWLALILSCICTGIYYKQEQLNSGLFGISTQSEANLTRKVPVTSYYPWEQIRFIDLIIEENTDVYVRLQYAIPSRWRLRGYREKWNAKITITVDVVLKVFKKEFVIPNVVFELEWEQAKGVTEKLAIVGRTFNINDIDEARIIMKSLEMPDGQRKSVYKVYAISNMNSNELERYREQIHYEAAVCREEKLECGWRCPCGLIHAETEKRCMVCGTAVSQKGEFIR